MVEQVSDQLADVDCARGRGWGDRGDAVSAGVDHSAERGEFEAGWQARQERHLADCLEPEARPDGRYRLGGARGNPGRCFDGAMDVIGDGKKIIDFAFNRDENLVAYSENDRSKTAQILDRRTGKTVSVDAGADQPDVIFSPDGSLLATGGYGSPVRLWSVPDGELVRELYAGPMAGGLTLEFSPDGRILAAGNRNSTTILYETATGKPLATLPKSESHELQFHPDGHTLAIVYVDGSVALWRVADGALLRVQKSGAEELYTVDWSPDGTLLATAGKNGKITLWDGRDLSVLRELTGPEWVIRVKFTPDGLNLHYAGGSGVQGGSRHLGVLGIEGSLYSLLNRPR